MKQRASGSVLIPLITLVITLDVTTGSPKATCQKTTSVYHLVEHTFPIHVDYIRIGVGSDLVFQFFNRALLSICDPKCVCTSYSVDNSCIGKHFLPDVDNATLDLWWVVADDWDKPDTDRLFPNVYSFDELPDPAPELEQWIFRKFKKITLLALREAIQLVHTSKTALPLHQKIVHLPADETVRFDHERDKACAEYHQKVNRHSLTLSAPTLTAYVFGVANQMLIASVKGKAPSTENVIVRNMLIEHVRLTYNAARCLRRSGNALQIPTIYMDQVVMKAHLVLLNSTLESSSTLLSSMPPLTAMRDIVGLSRRFFAGLVSRMSGMGSNGVPKYVTWTGTSVIVEDIQDVLLRNLTLLEVGGLAETGKDERGKLFWVHGGHAKCPIKYKGMERLDQVEVHAEYCCAESCMRVTGNIFDLFIMNEMCCFACNAHMCDVIELGKVLQAQASFAGTRQWPLGENL